MLGRGGFNRRALRHTGATELPQPTSRTPDPPTSRPSGWDSKRSGRYVRRSVRVQLEEMDLPTWTIRSRVMGDGARSMAEHGGAWRSRWESTTPPATSRVADADSITFNHSRRWAAGLPDSSFLFALIAPIPHVETNFWGSRAVIPTASVPWRIDGFAPQRRHWWDHFFAN